MTERNVADGYVDEAAGLVYKNVCAICFCVVHDGLMDAHLHWHEIAASPMAHGMYVYSMLPRSENG